MPLWYHPPPFPVDLGAPVYPGPLLYHPPPYLVDPHAQYPYGAIYCACQSSVGPAPYTIWPAQTPLAPPTVQQPNHKAAIRKHASWPAAPRARRHEEAGWVYGIPSRNRDTIDHAMDRGADTRSTHNLSVNITHYQSCFHQRSSPAHCKPSPPGDDQGPSWDKSTIDRIRAEVREEMGATAAMRTPSKITAHEDVAAKADAQRKEPEMDMKKIEAPNAEMDMKNQMRVREQIRDSIRKEVDAEYNETMKRLKDRESDLERRTIAIKLKEEEWIRNYGEGILNGERAAESLHRQSASTPTSEIKGGIETQPTVTGGFRQVHPGPEIKASGVMSGKGGQCLPPGVPGVEANILLHATQSTPELPETFQTILSSTGFSNQLYKTVFPPDDITRLSYPELGNNVGGYQCKFPFPGAEIYAKNGKTVPPTSSPSQSTYSSSSRVGSPGGSLSTTYGDEQPGLSGVEMGAYTTVPLEAAIEGYISCGIPAPWAYGHTFSRPPPPTVYTLSTTSGSDSPGGEKDQFWDEAVVVATPYGSEISGSSLGVGSDPEASRVGEGCEGEHPPETQQSSHPPDSPILYYPQPTPAIMFSPLLLTPTGSSVRSEETGETAIKLPPSKSGHELHITISRSTSEMSSKGTSSSSSGGSGNSQSIESQLRENLENIAAGFIPMGKKVRWAVSPGLLELRDTVPVSGKSGYRHERSERRVGKGNGKPEMGTVEPPLRGSVRTDGCDLEVG